MAPFDERLDATRRPYIRGPGLQGKCINSSHAPPMYTVITAPRRLITNERGLRAHVSDLIVLGPSRALLLALSASYCNGVLITCPYRPLRNNTTVHNNQTHYYFTEETKMVKRQMQKDKYVHTSYMKGITEISAEFQTVGRYIEAMQSQLPPAAANYPEKSRRRYPLKEIA
ncbi:hypothetical protein CBL_01983 [Carabus blaptoides fortunei]